MQVIKIGGLEVGDGKPVLVIAEIGLCHNGKLELAKELIDVAVEAGADMVKFQKRDVDNLAIPAVLDAPDDRFPSLGATYRQIRKAIEFGEKEYDEIFAYCAKKDIAVFCTVFDINSAKFLEKYNPPAVKVASHSITNLPLLSFLAEWQKPVILSTGMCTFEEIDDAIKIFRERDCPIALLHCVSSYPTRPEEANLRMIDVLRKRYDVSVGLSSHEIGTLVSLAGVSRGAHIIERHITLDHDMDGFDHKIALTSPELTEFVQKVREIEKMLVFSNKEITEVEWLTRRKYQVSAIAARDLEPGLPVSENDFVFKNPGTGLTPKQASCIIGKTPVHKIKKDEIITLEMFR